ncbi:MAG: hypothetical protein KJ709_03450, partial [Nanoarchaeota archaeon]|nr:hypothetical protein [Nanoarchaeota archaeon]
MEIGVNYIDLSYYNTYYDCSYEDTNTETTCGGAVGEWYCSYISSDYTTHDIPHVLYYDEDSPCQQSENAYLPRDICIQAEIHVDDPDYNDFYAFGDCDIPSGTDYITYEVPDITTAETEVSVGEPFTVLIDANAHSYINFVMIDKGCWLEDGHCSEDQFSADVTIDGFELYNPHHTVDDPYQLTFNEEDLTYCQDYECGVGMKVLTQDGNSRFDEGFMINVYDPSIPTCQEAGGQECCSQGWACTGSVVGEDTTCGSECCMIDCLPLCEDPSGLDGKLCVVGSSCEGGQFQDSADGSQGGSARCCVDGMCTLPPSVCSDYPDNTCCPSGEVCYGATMRDDLPGCGGNTCYLGCVAGYCVPQSQVCTSDNPALGSCGLPELGEMLCANSEILCICGENGWEEFQVCGTECIGEEGSAKASGDRIERIQTGIIEREEVLHMGDQELRYTMPPEARYELLVEDPPKSRQILNHYCRNDPNLGWCEESDNGVNDPETYGICKSRINGENDDACIDDTHVREYYCDASDNCVGQATDCPSNSVCVMGQCVVKKCPAITKSNIGNMMDVLCRPAFDKDGNLIKYDCTYGKELIQICTQDVWAYVKPLIFTNDQVGKDAVNRLFDGAMVRLWSDVFNHFASVNDCNANPDPGCQADAADPSEILAAT